MRTRTCTTPAWRGATIGTPDIAIGRWSITSVDELQAIVNKTLHVERGNYPDPDYVRRGAFLANPSTQGMAEPSHDDVIDTFFTPNDYTGVKLYAAQGAGTQDVRNAINDGVLFVVYYGHSSSNGWWDPAFDSGDIQSLSNTGLYPVAMGWSCNTAHFSYDECFGETWIREANKGAVAYISASNYIYWGSVEAWRPSTIHERSFFAALFEDDIWTLGPAWQAGCYRFLVDFGEWDGDPNHPPTANVDVCRNFVEEFVLLGDPALQLPQPDGFSLDSSPMAHALCAPPDDEAVYVVNVGQLGTFDEDVTLSLSGAPAGATVDFSVNGVAPPFVSQLTVANLTGVAEGDYLLTINGTSSSKQRSLVVELQIASAPAEAVQLTSPANGATGVALRPTLAWAPAAGALSYDLQIATTPSFDNVLYTRTVTAESHTVEDALGMAAAYFWRVRGLNPCGAGDWSTPFSFVTVNMIAPAYYDLLNGETGSYSYFDDAYDGDGDNTVPLEPLSNGLGELTDGVLATEHWNSTSGPYVGWKSIEPTITFHFDAPVTIDVLTIHVDDSGGGGGVVPPSDIEITMGGEFRSFAVSDPAGSAPFAASFTNLSLTGTQLELTLLDDGFTSSRYMMLSEVEFFGQASTGACCIDSVCQIMTEAECVIAGGAYQGDDTTCDPSPCLTQEPGCLIISEVVDGTESGGCPKWIEITNTGLNDFVFFAGGVIVQMDDSTDLEIDVDLTGVVIPAGEELVINSNHGGNCGGAFPFIYGIQPDVQTDALFGDGNDRYILTDTADASNILDTYGEIGVNGTGTVWDYTQGYSYRLSSSNSGNGGVFDPSEWFFGGPGSLTGGDPTQLLLAFTDPARHTYDEPCTGTAVFGDLNGDGVVDGADFVIFATCMAGPDVTVPPNGVDPDTFAAADLDDDGDVDLHDAALLSAAVPGS
jgi:hypothetical protein